MADDLTPRPISHGPNALWEMRAEMDRLSQRAERAEKERDNLAFEKREVARHLELVRMRLSAAEAERDALKAATERVRTLHSAARAGDTCYACGDDEWLDGQCPTIRALDHPVDTTGETETR